MDCFRGIGKLAQQFAFCLELFCRATFGDFRQVVGYGNKGAALNCSTQLILALRLVAQWGNAEDCRLIALQY